MGERGPTRFAKGAFTESLKANGGRFPLLWQHHDDEPVGVARMSETAEGLALEGELAMDVAKGREAHALMKMKAIDGVSIGFTAIDHIYEKQGDQQVRVVKKAKLAEASIVTFPADKAARVRTVHADGDMLDAAASLILEEVQAAEREMESHEGRVFSTANLGKLREALGSLVDLIQKVDPGHVVKLGRKASALARKSFIFKSRKPMPPPGLMRASALRRIELLALGCDASPVVLVPKARTFDDLMDEQKQMKCESALFRSISSILDDTTVQDKAPLLRQTVEQYLIASGAAEAVDEGADDGGAAAASKTIGMSDATPTEASATTGAAGGTGTLTA